MIRTLLRPLPRTVPKPNLKRLPKGKAVSIGVGFRCDLGIVLCSDTQITWKGRHKAYETKQFYPCGHEWTMASVYAGDPQLWKSFCNKFMEYIEAHYKANAREPNTTKELREILETTLCYFSELDSDPLALCLLVGFVIRNKEIRLVKTEGKLISDVDVFDHVGCGDSSLLRYLTPITAEKDRWPTISQALYAGTYWVLQAKRWVEDCGGDTEAFVLHWKGTVHNRNGATYNWEQHLLGLELNLATMLKTLGDPTIKDEDFEDRLTIFSRHLREERGLLRRGL
ncbi:MAG: hypothetical protein ABSE82_14320 [Nitrososphaerales archaeon]|jgi:hypothetical protein